MVNESDEALLGAAIAKRNAGDLAGAEDCYRRLLSRGAGHAGALHDLGVICLLTGRGADAVGCFRDALALEPARAETHNALGAALRERDDLREAERHLLEAVRLAPAFAEAHNNLGLARMALGGTVGGIESFRRAAALAPGMAAAWENLGCALVSRGEAAAALDPLEQACALAPRNARAAGALGAALGALKRYPEAIAALERAVTLAPQNAGARLDLVHLRQQVCDWTALAGEAAAVRAAVSAGAGRPVSPFFFMMLPGATTREQRICAERWARLFAGSAQAGPPRRPHSGGKLRIGYLSGEFHEHASMRLMAGVFEHHDRARFEITAFSCGPRSGDAMRARLEAAFGGIVDVSGDDDRSAADRIGTLGIDILVVGELYGLRGRPGIAALRPAPVQAAYLGHPGTTGAPFIDYLIADRVVVPPGAADAYSERVAYLPDTYQCNDGTRPAVAPPARGACGLPADGFVFCCFNQTYKIAPDVFDVWCRLLGAVPGSVLWLWASNPWAPDRLRAAARARGLDPARLVFAPTKPWKEHVARIGAADLFLDTFPCTAHTTASDALWAGVPVVTCAGETFVSRVAASVLNAAGLPELVTDSLAHYEALALRLAGDRPALTSLREQLAANRRTVPLFDTARFTRNLEAVYETIWRRTMSGER